MLNYFIMRSKFLNSFSTFLNTGLGAVICRSDTTYKINKNNNFEVKNFEIWSNAIFISHFYLPANLFEFRKKYVELGIYFNTRPMFKSPSNAKIASIYYVFIGIIFEPCRFTKEMLWNLFHQANQERWNRSSIWGVMR